MSDWFTQVNCTSVRFLPAQNSAVMVKDFNNDAPRPMFDDAKVKRK